MDVQAWIPVAMLVAGSGGLIAVLKYQRDDAGKAIANADGLVAVMKGITDELLEALERERVARVAAETGQAEAIREMERCRELAVQLRAEIAKLERLLARGPRHEGES